MSRTQVQSYIAQHLDYDLLLKCVVIGGTLCAFVLVFQLLICSNCDLFQILVLARALFFAA